MEHTEDIFYFVTFSRIKVEKRVNFKSKLHL